jgi:hypothetical protein
MKQISKIFIIAIAVFTWFSSDAQVKDSASCQAEKDTLKIFWMNDDAFDFKYIEPSFQQIDTTLTGAQKKFLLNEKVPFAAKFSNSGLAYRNLEFQSNYSFDFVSSRQYYKDYLFSNENAKYFNVVSPYANVFYVMGPKREQIFDVLFTRNFKKNLNLSANYKLIHSTGKYKRQKSDDAFVQLTGNYSTKNHRYVVLGNYFYNRLKTQENGGIKNDSDFTQNLEPNRPYIEVNLDNPDNPILSNNAENHIKESGVFVKQFYFIGFGGKKENDTLKISKPYMGLGRISHSFLFKNQSYTYIDQQPLSGYYPATLISPDSTVDSIHISTIQNTLSWSNLKFENQNNRQRFICAFGLMHRSAKLYSYNTDTIVSSIIPDASFIFKPFSKLEFSTRAFYILDGYNKGDYSLTGLMSKNLSVDSTSEKNIGVKAEIFKQSPMWFDQKYFANNFSWDYQFNPMTVKKVSAFYKARSFNVILAYYQIKNYIYFDNYARPKQFADYLELIQLNVVKDFKWRKWEIDNKIVYQRNLDANIIRLPELMTNHAFYFTQDLLKKALTMQLGMEVTFMNSYSALAWMAATREFYIQDDYKTDNYSFIDIFVNVKIKRASIYLKLDHANSGLMGYNYFLIPHNPMSDRGIKFGVSWKFYN